MSIDTPDNYYAILGVPIDADDETLKRAYRQLARRYHPDLAGPEGAVQMKRINRAYDVLSDPEKRLQYDTIIGGTIDLRKSGLVRPRRRPQRVNPEEELEFAGLSIFSTKGPLHTGARIRSALGVITAISSARADDDLLIACGTTDGKGAVWSAKQQKLLAGFATDPELTVESLRELRFSRDGRLLVGWGRLAIHAWSAHNGALLWSYPLTQRAVFDHYTLDTALQEGPDGRQQLRMALPYLSEDPRMPQKVGVRATDVITHTLGSPREALEEALTCPEEELEKRQFWAIRLRTLSRDARSLLTLSCGRTPERKDEVIIVRRWDLTAHTRFGNKPRPRIAAAVLAGRCADCTPPYAVTADAGTFAFVSGRDKIRVQDFASGTYYELEEGTMGGTSRLAISGNANRIAVAREDSEVNEGVIDLWSVAENRIVQKLYHPWQISALHFADQRLIVALTDGTIQVWE